MKTKKILVTRKFPVPGIKLLEQHNFKLSLWDRDRPMTQDELIAGAKEHNCLFCTLTDRIDNFFLSRCSHLDIISQFAVGFDNIDVQYATKLGIPIGFTPDAMSEATADIAFGLMIAVARKMFFMHKTISRGQWGSFNPTGHLGIELKNRTLGIFGLGRIGLKMAERCKNAYNMKIIYHNRTPNRQAEKLTGACHVSFDELLARSDILSVHCSLTPETRHVFNKTAFRKMKNSAIFINTARGPVHNEKDLIQAIKTTEILGAGLDVTDPEPMSPDNELLKMENACVLPHIGSATIDARNQMSIIAAENIISFYENGRPLHIVNPEVFES
jgi:glyoxylate reductase